MTLGEVHEIILVGAGTRVPKVQEMLNDFIGKDKELGKNLNTDEAACMGAVYKAADLSTGFRVSDTISTLLFQPIRLSVHPNSECLCHDFQKTIESKDVTNKSS